MALTTANSGSQACTVTTSHLLDTDTTAGIYVCMWNLTTSVKGDVFRCWATTKVLTGDTAEIIFEGGYANDLLDSPIIMSPPIVSMFEINMYINQTAGTSRTIPWSNIRVAT